jgi:hypothetical protein
VVFREKRGPHQNGPPLVDVQLAIENAVKFELKFADKLKKERN